MHQSRLRELKKQLEAAKVKKFKAEEACKNRSGAILEYHTKEYTDACVEIDKIRREMGTRG